MKLPVYKVLLSKCHEQQKPIIPGMFVGSKNFLLGLYEKQSVTNYRQPNPFLYRNFRASKAKGQEIGRLPSQEKIDCFTISFQPLRVELEIMNRRYWDILVQSLHNAIIKDISTIEKFTEEAVEVRK